MNKPNPEKVTELIQKISVVNEHMPVDRVKYPWIAEHAKELLQEVSLCEEDEISNIIRSHFEEVEG